MVASAGGRAVLLAGGTDLLPNLKRRQFDVDTLVQVPAANGVREGAGMIELGATVTLARAAGEPRLRALLPGFAEAAGLVSSPPLRNAGTLGGNLCVDTRCNYYNQTHEWRKSIGYCLKKDGDICLVAPGSPRCWAVSSSDTAPMAIVLSAMVTLVGPDGERQLPVSALYRDDGIDYLAKQPYEVLTSISLPLDESVRTAYVKLRRRASIDFPIAGAAVALRMDGDRVEWCRIALSAVASHPVEAVAAGQFLAGQRLDPESITAAAELAAKPAKPLDNTDLTHFWRKRMVRVVVENALTRAATANRS
ncbi:MAG: FAD binding domain-containing protein [Candidatus Dormibacteraeota bacterium]|nr:FAD binding domain-containing protein [Candidatus Dormibacteraeota bacterium]